MKTTGATEKKCAIVLLGPAGSGKTTLARALLEPGMSAIETGNLLEAEIRRQSALGEEIKPYKTAGELVPLELVKRVISAQLARSPDGLILFDGFPRSLEQTGLLLELLPEHRRELCSVFILKLDLADSIKRLSGRRICSKCGALYNIYSSPPSREGICDRCGSKLVQRDDDREELVRRRFVTFERETLPVVEFFQREYPRLTWEISSAAPPPEVVEQVRKRLKATGP